MSVEPFMWVTRGFTDIECKTYGIDPCSTTLEDLRERLIPRRFWLKTTSVSVPIR